MFAVLLALSASANSCSVMINISSTSGPQFINTELKKKQRLCINATDEAGLALIFNNAHDSIVSLHSHLKEDELMEDVETLIPEDSTLLGVADFGASKVGSAEIYAKEDTKVSIAAAILPDACRESTVRVLSNRAVDSMKAEVANGRSVCYFNGFSTEQSYKFTSTGGEVRVFSEGTSAVAPSSLTVKKPNFVVFRSTSAQGSIQIELSQTEQKIDFTEVRAELKNKFGTKLVYGELVLNEPLERATLLMIVVFALLMIAALVAVAVAFLCFACRAKPIHTRPIVLDEHPSLMQAAMAETQGGDGDGMKARLVEAAQTV